ncbi:hypothetical protein DFJ74DRAFT_771760, partial [Hyaloraphidium curvatum]
MSEEYGRRLASLGLDPARTAGITPAQVASMLGLHSTDSIDEVLSEMERASPGEVTAASVRAGKTLDVLVAWHLGSVLRKEVDVLPPELAEAVRRKLDAETQGVEEMARRLNGELQRARALGAEARADLLTLQEKVRDLCLASLPTSDFGAASETGPKRPHGSGRAFRQDRGRRVPRMLTVPRCLAATRGCFRGKGAGAATSGNQQGGGLRREEAGRLSAGGIAGARGKGGGGRIPLAVAGKGSGDPREAGNHV